MSWSGIADRVLDLRVTTTAALVVFTVLAVIALTVLVARRERRWLLVWVPATVALTAASVWAAAFLVEHVWRLFPDRLSLQVYAWAGIALLAVLLLAARWFVRRRDRSRPLVALGLIAAALAAVIAGAGHINAVFDAYPTVRAALGIAEYRTVPLDAVLAPVTTTDDPRPLYESWSPPPDMPATGAVTTASIPGIDSGFHARDAHIYFPPAYFTDPRPALPVLVLLAGQPGSTEDWLIGGRLTHTMDSFAAEHDGLAPIVVLADGTGGQFDNPLCVDSPLGNAATYLSVDVSAWVRAHLQVDGDPSSWAVGGLSYGGTCALQLATTRPDVYPTFLDLSGQSEPTLGDRARTVREVFGGDEAAFARNNPADLLARNRYPASAGAFVVGVDDHEYRSGIEQLVDAARAAGMDVHLTELPGGHSFALWSAGLETELPWLSRRLGLVAP